VAASLGDHDSSPFIWPAGAHVRERSEDEEGQHQRCQSDEDCTRDVGERAAGEPGIGRADEKKLNSDDGDDADYRGGQFRPARPAHA
jgi:hypothetical protein